MAKYHLTNKAVQDLSDIWNYTYDEWSEKQADKYYSLLLDSCQELAENPTKGKKYDIVTDALLGYKSNEHIIFYQIIDTSEIEVIRILHGMMDLKTKL
jgi:toxin ParE1/3/4